MITEIPELRKLMVDEEEHEQLSFRHDLRDCLKAEGKGKMGYEHREVSERPYGQGVGGIGAPSSQAQEAWIYLAMTRFLTLSGWGNSSPIPSRYNAR